MKTITLGSQGLSFQRSGWAAWAWLVVIHRTCIESLKRKTAFMVEGIMNQITFEYENRIDALSQEVMIIHITVILIQYSEI